jgi:uncharacterized protein YbjQ (UPF0145 family)
MRLGNVDGIEFYDDVPANTRMIETVTVQVGSFISDSDEADRHEIMKRLARLAKNAGADSVVELKVEPAASSWLAHAFGGAGRMSGSGAIAVVRSQEPHSGPADRSM